MRMPSKKSETGEATPEPVLIMCAKCLCEFDRARVRKYPSIGGNTQAFILCDGCSAGLASDYQVGRDLLGALTLVLSIEREERDRARSDIRYGNHTAEQRGRLVRQLDIALATADRKKARVNQGATELADLIARFTSKSANHLDVQTWAAKYRRCWRLDHALTPDLQALFGWGETVQSEQEMATL